MSIIIVHIGFGHDQKIGQVQMWFIWVEITIWTWPIHFGLDHFILVVTMSSPNQFGHIEGQGISVINQILKLKLFLINILMFMHIRFHENLKECFCEMEHKNYSVLLVKEWRDREGQLISKCPFEVLFKSFRKPTKLFSRISAQPSKKRSNQKRVKTKSSKYRSL